MAEWALGYASDGGFPSFAPVFNPAEGFSVAPYLTLVNLVHDAESWSAIKVVRGCMAASPDLAREVVALFLDRNWRPQLVGCIAVLLGAINEETIAALWKAFDNGSWLSPQLAVTAFRCDLYFKSEAVEYIEYIKTAQRRAGDDATLPRQLDPALANDSKSIAALLGLCDTVPALAVWAEEARKHPTVAAALETLYEDGGQIALYWNQQVEKVMGDAAYDRRKG